MTDKLTENTISAEMHISDSRERQLCLICKEKEAWYGGKCMICLRSHDAIDVCVDCGKNQKWGKQPMCKGCIAKQLKREKERKAFKQVATYKYDGDILSLDGDETPKMVQTSRSNILRFNAKYDNMSTTTGGGITGAVWHVSRIAGAVFEPRSTRVDFSFYYDANNHGGYQLVSWYFWIDRSPSVIYPPGFSTQSGMDQGNTAFFATEGVLTVYATEFPIAVTREMDWPLAYPPLASLEDLYAHMELRPFQTVNGSNMTISAAVSISGFQKQFVEIDVNSPLPVNITNSIPLNVGISSSAVTLQTQVANTPLPVSVTNSLIPVTINSTVPVNIQNTTVPVTVQNQIVVSGNLNTVVTDINIPHQTSDLFVLVSSPAYEWGVKNEKQANNDYDKRGEILEGSYNAYGNEQMIKFGDVRAGTHDNMENIRKKNRYEKCATIAQTMPDLPDEPVANEAKGNVEKRTQWVGPNVFDIAIKSQTYNLFEILRDWEWCDKELGTNTQIMPVMEEGEGSLENEVEKKVNDITKAGVENQIRKATEGGESQKGRKAKVSDEDKGKKLSKKEVEGVKERAINNYNELSTRRAQYDAGLTRLRSKLKNLFGVMGWILTSLSEGKNIEILYVIDLIKGMRSGSKMMARAKYAFLVGWKECITQNDAWSLVNYFVMIFAKLEEEQLSALAEKLNSNLDITIFVDSESSKLFSERHAVKRFPLSNIMRGEYDSREEIAEGSFNPYGNGQTELPLDDVGIVEVEGHQPMLNNPVHWEATKLEEIKNQEEDKKREEQVKLPRHVSKFIIARHDVEAAILRRMEQASGQRLTRTEADQLIRKMGDSDNTINRLLTDTVAAMGKNKYIGPGYTGGVYGGAVSLRDLAERFMTQSSSALDELAREHDMVYWTTKDIKARTQADRDLRDGALGIGTPQALAVAGAMQAHIMNNNLEEASRAALQQRSANPGRNRWVKDLTKEGIEPNPGPYDRKYLIELIMSIVRVVNDDWERKTALGFIAPNSAGPEDVAEPAYIDQYYINRCMQRAITVLNRAETVYGTYSVWTCLPVEVLLQNSTIQPMNFNPNNYINIQPQFGGRGINLIPGRLGRMFNDPGLDTFQMLRSTNLSGALANGNTAYIIYAMIQSGTEAAYDPTGGSNAMILSQIYDFSILSSVNCRMMPFQKHVRGCCVKPLHFQGLLNNLYTNLRPGGLGVRLWMGSLAECTQWIASGLPIDARINAFDSPPIFVYVMNTWLNPAYRTALTLYILAHGPGIPWKFRETMRMKLADAAFTKVDFSGESTLCNVRSDYPFGANAALNFVIIKVDAFAQAGALGQPNPNSQFTFGTSPANSVNVTTAANDPFANASVHVDATAVTHTAGTHLRQLPMTSALNQAANFWATEYGCETDLRLAKILTALKLFRGTQNPTTSMSSNNDTPPSRYAFDIIPGNTFNVPNMTQDTWNDTLVYNDMFGQNCSFGITATSNYFYGAMNPVRRLSLCYGVMEYAQERVTKVDPFTPTQLYFHLVELGEITAAYSNSIYSSCDVARGVLDGYLLPGGSNNMRVEISKAIVFSYLEDNDVEDMLWSLPVQRPAPITTDYVRCDACTYDKDFDIMHQYESPSEDIYRDTPWEPSPASEQLQLGLGVNLPNTVMMVTTKITESKTLSKALMPRITWTRLSQQYNGSSLDWKEGQVLTTRPVYSDFIWDTNLMWLATFVGAGLSWDVNPITFDPNIVILDYTIQPVAGPKLKHEQHVAMNTVAQSTFGSKATPMYVAFKAVTVPITGFLNPSVIGNTSGFTKMLETLTSKVASDKSDHLEKL